MAGIPFINYIVDHPLDHIYDMKNVPKEYYVICMDREYVEFIKSYLHEVKDAFFLPLGGIQNKNSIGPVDREYDVVFTGTLFDISEIEKNILALPPNIQGLIIDAID